MKVVTEQSTEVEAAVSYTGHPAIAVRFNHSETIAAIVGLTREGALTLIAQLAKTLKEQEES